MAVERVFTAAELAEAAAIAGDEPQGDSWTPINLNDLPETPPVPPELGNTHLVYPGKRHVFSGPPESAKTLAAYCVMIQVARCGGDCILIDFEMGGHDARQRLRELGATASEIDRIAYLEPDEPVTTRRIAALVSMRPELVVIDASAGIYSLEGLDDNKRGDVEKISNLYVRVFWRNGVATILIDHVVKDGEARGRYAIGSERKLGGADVHFGFVTANAISRGTEGLYRIHTHKDRGGYHKRGHVADLHLSSDPVTHQIEWSVREPVVTADDTGKKRLTTLMEKCSRELEQSDEPITTSAMVPLVRSSKGYVSDALNSLVHEGYASRAEAARGAFHHTSLRPYRTENDPLLGVTGTTGTQWFTSGSCTGEERPVHRYTTPIGGVPVEPVTSGERTAQENGDRYTQEAGWFDENGNLFETTIETPDDDELFA